MSTPNFILFSLFISAIIVTISVLIGYVTIIGIHSAFGQNVTPPIIPTPVPNPTPTQPNPNFQYLPQKAAVQVYTPEVGIPANTPQLQVVPQVVPAPVPQQSSGLGIPGLDIAAVLALVGTGVTYFKSHLVGKKAEKAETTSQENAAMNVKQAVVQEEALKLQYENMGADKANAITDKPEIRLTELAKLKDTTIETATKA